MIGSGVWVWGAGWGVQSLVEKVWVWGEGWGVQSVGEGVWVWGEGWGVQSVGEGLEALLWQMVGTWLVFKAHRLLYHSTLGTVPSSLSRSLPPCVPLSIALSGRPRDNPGAHGWFL